MPNLLDLMTEDDRQKALESSRKRVSAPNGKISPVVMEVAKLGFYYGWSAIEAVKRGYVEKDGEKIMLTMDEVSTLVDAAEKIWAQKCIDLAHCSQIGTASAMAKSPKKVFTEGVKPWVKRATA